MRMTMLLIFLFVTIAAIVVIYTLYLWRMEDMRKQAPKLESDAGVRDLVVQGRINEAIEVYRAFTGTDLYTARERVADIEREIRLGAQYAQVERLVRGGDKAAAIEMYQEITGAELSQALAAIEEIEKRV